MRKGHSKSGSEDIESKSGVSQIQVPVWCEADQNDIYWYTAQKQSDGTYKVKVSIANHKYHSGEYKIDTYLTGGNGLVVQQSGNKTTVKPVQAEITVKDIDKTEKEYQLNVTNAGVFGNLRQVQFAVWSEENGQDDIQWINGTAGANGSWSSKAIINQFKSYGTYNVHIYGTLENGTSVFMGNTTFEVSKPTWDSKDRKPRMKKREHLMSSHQQISIQQSGVSQIQVPVWCEADQNDIYWYTAQKQSDGTYKVKVSIANHKYHSGEYKIDTYLTGGNGLVVQQSGNKTTVKPVQAEITVKDIDKTEKEYQLNVTNAGVFGNLRQVQFAVWSEENGQDDIQWINGTAGANGSWSSKAIINQFKSYGTYNVHIYGTLENGTSVFMGNTTFEVSKPTWDIKIENQNEEAGTFDVVISNIDSASGVSQIPGASMV